MPRRRLKEVINSTGRLRIREADVSLSVTEDPASARIVRLDLPQPGSEAFENAEVWIEAAQSRTASFDRWSVGSAGAVRERRPVCHRALANFVGAADALFTVKVVAPDGRILASGEDIRPDDRRMGEREALLQVRSRAMGEVVWDIDIHPDGQAFLLVNSRIPAAETWLDSDPVAMALVLPAAVGIVLRHWIGMEGAQDNDWGRAWLEWAASMSPMEQPERLDTEAHEEWIAATVKAFAERNSLNSRLVDALEKKGDGQ